MVDLILRRRQYDGPGLGMKGGRYWYASGYRWRGIAALAFGAVMTALFAQTSRLHGPLSENLVSGMNFSALFGLVSGAGAYWLLCRSTTGPAPTSEAPEVAPDAFLAEEASPS